MLPSFPSVLEQAPPANQTAGIISDPDLVSTIRICMLSIDTELKLQNSYHQQSNSIQLREMFSYQPLSFAKYQLTNGTCTAEGEKSKPPKNRYLKLDIHSFDELHQGPHFRTLAACLRC